MTPRRAPWAAGALALAAATACVSDVPVARYQPTPARGPLIVLKDDGEKPPAPALARVEKKKLTLLVDVSGLGLFRDEDYQAKQQVAAWAAARGLHVVDVDKAVVVMSRARAGRNVDSNETCGAPLSEYEARVRYAATLGATGQLHSDVRCDAAKRSCTLSTWISTAMDFDGQSIEEREGPFDPSQPWPAALAAALAAQQPLAEDDSGGGGLGLLGGLMGGVVTPEKERLSVAASPARATDMLEWGAFKDALKLRGAGAPLRACFKSGGAHADLLVEFGADGAVARCESRSDDSGTHVCACDALGASVVASGALLGKRADVSVSYGAASIVTPDASVVSASVNTYLDRYQKDRFRPLVSDRSIADWTPPDDIAFERCLADASASAPFGAFATVTFDGRGVPNHVELRPSVGAPFTDAQLACVQRALFQSRAPCPAQADLWAKAELRFMVRRVGSSLQSPLGQ